MEVKIHTSVMSQYDAWRMSLSEKPNDRTRLAREFWDEFVAAVSEAKGAPAGSFEAPEFGAGWYWVAFPPCYRALVWFRDTGGVFGLLTVKKAVVMEFDFSPGLPG